METVSDLPPPFLLPASLPPTLHFVPVCMQHLSLLPVLDLRARHDRTSPAGWVWASARTQVLLQARKLHVYGSGTFGAFWQRQSMVRKRHRAGARAGRVSPLPFLVWQRECASVRILCGLKRARALCDARPAGADAVSICSIYLSSSLPFDLSTCLPLYLYCSLITSFSPAPVSRAAASPAPPPDGPRPAKAPRR